VVAAGGRSLAMRNKDWRYLLAATDDIDTIRFICSFELLVLFLLVDGMSWWMPCRITVMPALAVQVATNSLTLFSSTAQRPKKLVQQSKFLSFSSLAGFDSLVLRLFIDSLITIIQNDRLFVW
jgi:hypothetical protein